MKKMINGEMVEGSPSEILEYERLLQGSETTVARAAGGEPFRAGGMVVHRIGQAGNQNGEAKLKRFRTVEVSERQYLVLDEMRKIGAPITAAEVAEKVGIGRPEVSTSMFSLKNKKLVVRVNGHWQWELTDRGANCPIDIKRSRA